MTIIHFHKVTKISVSPSEPFVDEDDLASFYARRIFVTTKEGRQEVVLFADTETCLDMGALPVRSGGNPGDHVDNLTQLNKAKAGLSIDGRTSFNNYLVGALSTEVSSDIWEKCLDIAQRCIKESQDERADSSE